jgi:ABC-type polysaccharide/polyol phosphate transport system ATPase subunit
VAFISIRGLSVEFAIFGAHSRSLKNRILSQATGGRLMTGARDIVSVRAIEELDLNVRAGERLAISGHNGSGKTTLLRVLCGIYKPSAGSIDIEGKIGALINPVAGMDSEATGIENIYLRGYMLGMDTREIRSKIEEIADFTELGEFLDLPVRTYSAGMFTRLAFAVSTALQSDILLIDEGIGAGDADFQHKVQQRIEGLFSKSSIVLLASHNEGIIKQFCTRRITMERGRLISDEKIENDEISAASGPIA